MKMNETMLLWNSAEQHMSVVEKHSCRVAAVIHMSDEASRYSHLRKSTGACFGAWGIADPVQQASHFLSVFNQMVCGGVAVSDADHEFMKIDEYAEWKTNRTGPFAAAYWEAITSVSNEGRNW